ncbi:hypothetical protein H0H93_015222 [Arthromyces matolae]|nr:hypothetical protein H0H93_015222 [Arthromyces matolae]
MADSLQARLQLASTEFQELQGELSTAIEVRQRLDAQLSENELVKKVAQISSDFFHEWPDEIQQEFESVTAENRVFKLVGPVLVRQDPAEAKANVETRLEFIRSEMQVSPLVYQFIEKRVELQLKDIQGKQERKKAEVGTISFL